MSAQRPQVLGLQHVALPFPGTPEATATARRFYGTLVGLHEKPTPASIEGVLWFDVGGDTELHLYSEPEALVGRSRRHPCLRVRDLAALNARLSANDVEVIEPAEIIPGRRRLFAFDPFGNALEFAEFDSDQPG
jgi:extradiol dioxygenase family protein